MKKTLSMFLALVLALCLATAPALGEQSTRPAAFQPFEETVTVKVVMGYNESDIPKTGALPSTCEWNAMLKEYLNIEFDWLWEVPSTQYQTKLDLSLASGQYPDILQCDFNTYCYLKDAGMLADLTEVWDKYASDTLKEVIGPYLYFTTTEDGLMAIPYIPLSKASFATILLFTFVGHWNSWFDGYIYINSPSKYPLQTYLRTVIDSATMVSKEYMTEAELEALANINEKTLRMAQIFLGALPIMCVYPFLQKYFVKGITLGSVKE